MTTTTQHKTEVHENATNMVARSLIENGISTRIGTKKHRCDLVLNNGKTISVRGLMEDGRVPLMVNTSKPEWDYTIVVTHLKYTYPRLHIIPTEEVGNIGVNAPLASDGTDNWYVNESDYRNYRDNYDVLMR